MTSLILNIYDRFKKHPAMAWSIFLLLTGVLTWLFLTLSYKENIADFLPLDEDNQTALSVYQDISGANKIYAIISLRDTTATDPEALTSGVEVFADEVSKLDTLGYLKSVTTTVDMEKMLGVADAVYDNLPLFLTESDYARIDSLLRNPAYVKHQLEQDKQMLLFPSSNLLTANISRDPLNLFTPVLSRLRQSGMPSDFETYDGYILTPDSKKAVAILESAFGANESEHNASLVALLDRAKGQTVKANPDLEIHVIGGPVIAVGNANQIKTDSILAVCIAGVLILALLIYVFRNLRNILLIVVAVGWGWLFAMGAIALYYDSVSIIVIGIASIILGIAINYPLHLIDHLKDSAHPRSALKEIISPLVVGNVTTVGAFFCLVPLNSPALHDLGLFSSLLLVGAILFVLIFLPHVVKTRKAGSKPVAEPMLISRLANFNPAGSKWVVWGVLLLTGVFAWFSLRTEFDSDMRNINYMTDEQKADMAYFQQLFSHSADTEPLYVVSSGKNWVEALQQQSAITPSVDSLVRAGEVTRQNQVSSFLVSRKEQRKRLVRWKNFLAAHGDRLTAQLSANASRYGFSAEAFSQFSDILSREYTPKDLDELDTLVSTAFAGNVSEDKATGRKSVVQVINVPSASMESVKARLGQNKEFGGLFFDVKSMNGSIAGTLSNDFNYIGIACSVIVFLFLWMSLGSIELAIISFMPMAFSWIWILGIMGLLGIKFNIVNVILATFIFGQGDDYTIFMTEGLSYELAYRKRLLASYKSSIIVSALIMFIGIGTLLVAKHPALRSLGEVTVVGMASVVLMAYLFPPLMFNWLTRRGRQLRYRPITLKKMLYTGYSAAMFFLQVISAHVVGFCLFVLTKPGPKHRMLFHRYCTSIFRFDIKRIPGIKYVFKNDSGEDFSRPAVIICNHQSMLDSFCLMAITPRLVMLANEHVKLNPIVGQIFRWSNFFAVTDGCDSIISNVTSLVAEGYSVAVFPEGERTRDGDGSVKRFHKGAFQIAESLGLDIVPVYLNGLQRIMPKGSAFSNGGTMYLEVGERISRATLDSMGDILMQTKTLRAHYTARLSEIEREMTTVSEFAPAVYDRYRYKGRDIQRLAKHTLKWVCKRHSEFEGLFGVEHLLVKDLTGQGEVALLLALMYPESKVCCWCANEESRQVLIGSASGFVTNLVVVEKAEELESKSDSNLLFEI